MGGGDDLRTITLTCLLQPLPLELRVALQGWWLEVEEEAAQGRA